MSMRSRSCRALSIRPVNSVKHIVDTNGAVAAALQSTTDVINTVDSPQTIINPNQVHVGSNVKAIYLRVEVIGKIGAGGVDNIYMAVVKNPANFFTFPNLDNQGISTRRKYIIHQEMIMTTPQNLSDNIGFPRTLFKGVIVIPNLYQRNGINDRLQVLLQHRTGEVTQTTNFCIESIYKEFY